MKAVSDAKDLHKAAQIDIALDDRWYEELEVLEPHHNTRTITSAKYLKSSTESTSYRRQTVRIDTLSRRYSHMQD